MSFSLSVLQEYLLERYRIRPDQVTLRTDFRRDLQLSEADMAKLLAMVSQRTGLPFFTQSAQHLTDVFDLLVHVVLRLYEEDDSETYFGPIPLPLAERLPTTHYAPILAAYACTHSN